MTNLFDLQDLMRSHFVICVNGNCFMQLVCTSTTNRFSVIGYR